MNKNQIKECIVRNFNGRNSATGLVEILQMEETNPTIAITFQKSYQKLICEICGNSERMVPFLINVVPEDLPYVCQSINFIEV